MPIIEVIGDVVDTGLTIVGREAFLSDWFNGCKKRIAEQRGIPGNHDIVKGIRSAHLCALRYVAEHHKTALKTYPENEIGSDEFSFSASLIGFLEERLRKYREHNLDSDVVTLDDLEHVLDDILKPSIQEDLEQPKAETKELAIARALEEVEKDAGRKAPPIFLQAFDGQAGAAGWYEAFSLYIAEELKTNDRFRAVFEAGQLVDLKHAVGQIADNLLNHHQELSNFLSDTRNQLNRIEENTKHIRLSVDKLTETYRHELKLAEKQLQANESDLVSLLTYILEQHVKRENIPNALEKAWQRLSELRQDFGSLQSMANQVPEITALLEQASEALSSGDGFSLEKAGDALAEARKQFQKVIEEREEQRKRDQENLAKILEKEAEIALVRFDYSAATGFYKQQLESLKIAFSEEHPNTATSYNNVASNLDAQGFLSEAEPLYRKALEIRERLLGEEHPDTATSYNNLASNLNAQGRLSEAKPLYRKALEISERLLGEEHPDTATSYNNVASNLDDQERLSEAEPLYRKALEIRERVLGKEHPDTATSYNNIACNLNAQGRVSEAEPLYRKALEIMERMLGKEHPRSLMIANNLKFIK